ncbi:hypothetical protein Rhal01_03516 [Rubritalea halochordaticola]|uniref:Schlafen group 3-like DNA/RNA helicase domain-containing protein n=1 Tax=Rubritalea halochordaticola TaxID=714537 RepID=A0ABP9V477_9BACT
MNRYYYSSEVRDFLKESSNSILGRITDQNQFELTIQQKNAWNHQIEVLKQSLNNFPDAHLFFEYTIPRMGKRCDCILVCENQIFVLEFKCGASEFLHADKVQAIDYALDLKNFHAESHHLPIIPILVATDASAPFPQNLTFSDDKVGNCLLSNKDTLTTLIQESNDAQKESPSVDPHTWANSSYKPTPTIIEAAKALYRDHKVDAISSSGAERYNLTKTAEFIDQVIADAKASKHKSICFVTGVPGAGKTLAGLNLSTERNQVDKGEHAVFLSGNGPLVSVLQRALAEDRRNREGESLKAAKQATSSFIQNIHHFRDDYLADTSAPIEKVVVFDEAQRAWTREKAAKFMKDKKQVADFDHSEPAFLLEVMNRHGDWCVVVALIGGGQEINDGEAGLPEWFKALNEMGEPWKVFYSPNLDSSEHTQEYGLEELLPAESTPQEDLHLSVSLRSFRAENLSTSINLLISNRSKEARQIIENDLAKYPIYRTRDLNLAKIWIRNKQRGSERIGLIASAGAKRLVPYGINMNVSIEPEKWFLGDASDIRSSDFLELAASQFDIQGLEIDWSIVCWDADLRYHKNQWTHHQFKGSKWQKRNKEIDQLYLRNAYRVLLTRARQGMVIFVPEGSDEDRTRTPAFYDGTYEYLGECGITELADS